ncbi:DUF6122 family protein [Kaistella sp.]|uniref:DUF6122 family protein n=1 Tax=Kaistella sp. TaxID=2782235 RepID=UPI003C6A8F8B
MRKYFFKNNWRKAYFIMLATMLVDLDCVFANRFFDPNRNSIGYHYLHSYPMVGLYFFGAFF